MRYAGRMCRLCGHNRCILSPAAPHVSTPGLYPTSQQHTLTKCTMSLLALLPSSLSLISVLYGRLAESSSPLYCLTSDKTTPSSPLRSSPSFCLGAWYTITVVLTRTLVPGANWACTRTVCPRWRCVGTALGIVCSNIVYKVLNKRPKCALWDFSLAFLFLPSFVQINKLSWQQHALQNWCASNTLYRDLPRFTIISSNWSRSGNTSLHMAHLNSSLVTDIIRLEQWADLGRAMDQAELEVGCVGGCRWL